MDSMKNSADLALDELTPIAQLGNAFNFSSNDLKANRTGKITARQRRAIWRRLFAFMISWLLLLIIPIVIGFILVEWGTDQTFSEAFFKTEALSGYLTGLLLSSFYAVGQFNTLVMVIDTLRGKIRRVAGPVKRQGHYIYVKKYRFLLDTATLDLMQSGLQYRFYVLPSSHHILSVEFAE
jgi:hypothetical protein